jgi:hypothetical protein
MNRMRVFTFVLLLSVLTGCNGVDAPARTFIDLAGAIPQAWVDAPLDGMRIPLAPYEFVAHGSGEAGISQLEWVLNDASLGGMPAEGQDKLATFRYSWTPPGGGTYTLKVRAQDGSGAWSAYDKVTFTVGEPTPTDTPSTEITPTATPTATVTPTPTPTPAPAGLAFASQSSSAEFHYQRDCIPDPGSVTLTVTISGAPQPTGITLFFRFRNQVTGESGAWNEGLSMAPLGDGRFRASVAWDAIPEIDGLRSTGNPAFFIYQFVAIGPQATILGRSPTNSDIALTACQ